VKIDLGGSTLIDGIQFGRDRIGGYDDRDPGQFIVSVADYDAVYVNGDDSADAAEYRVVFDSAQIGYSGVISGKETVRVRFSPNPVVARFIKLQVANAGAAIDEIEVFGQPADEWPVVVQIPASASPPVPAGMKVFCTPVPGIREASATCPVLKWKGYTYWAFSYIDDRFAMGIVAYDSAGKAVAQWEKADSHYVWGIFVYESDGMVIFAGQDYSKVAMTLDELAIPDPAMCAVDQDTVPLGENSVGITVYSPDDHILCTLNGATVAQLNYGDGAIKEDLTANLRPGANEIRCIATDNSNGACYRYGFDVWTKRDGGAEQRVAGSAFSCCDASCARPGNPVMDKRVWVNKP